MSEPSLIGRYRVLRKLGEGGMGVVYAAHDESLDRPVALKLMREAAADEQARKRFWREARAAASVSHPNVCLLHEVGEHDGAPFIAMELLEGEPLSERIRRGPLPLGEALPVADGILLALEALHARNLVHRDLKPSNVFLTPHGVKLLDFGLARAVEAQDPVAPQDTISQLTQAGTIVGTPHYMAPEQLQGGRLDGRCDLFALGAMLFEMLSGRKAFDGRGMLEICHATLYEQPPALGGSPAIVAVDRVVRRALGKHAEDRYPIAAEMAQALRAIAGQDLSGAAARAVAMTRLIVLPFRALRPDADTDFLCFSLPDAITGSLSGLESLVVRSSLAAARFASDAPDLKLIATEADVDLVLTGSLLRAGEQLRVASQLVEAPAGTLIWSHTAQGPMGDVFRLQDDLVHRIVESLSLSLTAREHRALKQDVPASAKAYEFYLRANPLSLESKAWPVARSLYEQCLAEDPRYAPAWARLGRVYRLLSKWQPEASQENLRRAEAAFARALELSPELPIAHALLAQHESESGRTREALVRLLTLARSRVNDVQIYTSLVHACRYAGLLDASLAAYAAAVRLEPHVRTSICYTYFLLGEYERAVELSDPTDLFVRNYVHAALGHTREAIAAYRDMESHVNPIEAHIGRTMRAALEGETERVVAGMIELMASGFRDPEGWFFAARALAYAGCQREAVELLGRTVEQGFYCPRALESDGWLARVRDTPGFADVAARARDLHRVARQAFVDAGGEAVLGVAVDG